MASKTPAPAPVGHESTYPYASLAQAAAELGTAKDFILGGLTSADRNSGIKAVHTCLSFGLGMAFPHHAPVMGAADTTQAEALGAELTAACEKKSGAAAGAVGGAFSWLALVKLLLDLLGNLS